MRKNKKDDSFYIFAGMLIIMFLLFNKNEETIISTPNDIDSPNPIKISQRLDELKRVEFLLNNLSLEVDTEDDNHNNNLVKLNIDNNYSYEPAPYIPKSTFSYYLLGRGENKKFLIGLSNLTDKDQKLTFNSNEYYNYEVYNKNGELLYKAHDKIFEVFGNDIKIETLTVGSTKVFTLDLRSILEDGDDTYTLKFYTLSKETKSTKPIEFLITGTLNIPEEIITNSNEIEVELEESTNSNIEEGIIDKEDENDVELNKLGVDLVIENNKLTLVKKVDKIEDLFLIVDGEIIDIIFEENVFYFKIDEDILNIQISNNKDSKGIILFEKTITNQEKIE